MRLHSGTSGFSYGEWRGTFYPADLPDAGMLGYYAGRLESVEINNTFYQMPKEPLLERWRDAVAPGFCFALKAPRRITHLQRLRGSEESVAQFLKVAGVLGARLGPVLFQLPPFAKKDAVLLREFLTLLPPELDSAFEFRHPSWFDDEIFEVLRERRAALCGGDSDEGDRSPPLVPTADFGYLRLRAPSYDAAGIRAWHERIATAGFERAYVYFKHEVLGPLYAEHLRELVLGREPFPLPNPPAPPATPQKPKKRASKKPAVTPATETPPKKRAAKAKTTK
jgi:uncharacterized protein YecE (DUF72 family)